MVLISRSFCKMRRRSAFLLTWVSLKIKYSASGMMCLSQTTGYAIQALACLVNIGHSPCLIREMAAKTGVPKPYLARVINRLSRQGIVSAKRGHQGGVSLTRPAHEISLLEIVEAMEGKHWIGPCLFGLHKCNMHPVCPVHDFWTEVRQKTEDLLRRTTLTDTIASRARCPSHHQATACEPEKKAQTAESQPIHLAFPGR